MGTVFFDKTGTLTEPGFDLERIFVAPGVDRDWAISAAVALERASRHPVARALVAAFEGERLEPLRVSGVREEAGFGIEGGVGARRLFLGSVRWARDLGAEIGPDLGSGSTDGSEIVLMDDERVLAAFRLQERLREGAANALETLRMSGVEVAVLSGDSRERVDAVVARLRLPGFSRLLPLDKVDHLVRARSEGRPVAMVGDGVNDSLVLAAADVGISIGSASDLAARSGNVRLTTDRLDRIPLLFEIARDVRRRIAINLGFAFGFNTIGIALAATGRLTPVIAALAMVFSSVAVVRISSNAGRLAAPVSPPARGRDSVSAGHWEPAKEVAS